MYRLMDIIHKAALPRLIGSSRQQDMTETLAFSDSTKAEDADSLTQIIDKHSLKKGIRLVEVAYNELVAGNEAIGIDFYLDGLDRILVSMNSSKSEVKEALKDKLLNVQERMGIEQTTADKPVAEPDLSSNWSRSLYQSIMSSSWMEPILEKDEQDANQEAKVVPVVCGNQACIHKFKVLNSKIADMVVRCVALYRDSPIPGLLYCILTYFVYVALWIEKRFHVVDKLRIYSLECVHLLLVLDDKCHLHDFISEAIHVVLSTFVRAVLEYAKQEEPVVSTD